MPSRRTFLAWSAGAAAVAGAGALVWRAQQLAAGIAFTDAAGRVVQIPARVERVFAAGPPASVMLYVLAPEKMLGWTRAPSARALPFVAEPYRALPTVGMLTGRGNTASLEQVVALAPDLILDCGDVDRTYASLADRTQAQAGVPYVLLDGAFLKSGAVLRTLGNLLGVEARAERLATYAEHVLSDVRAVSQRADRARVYYGRGAEGLETGRAGSITTELLELMADNVAQAAGEGGLTNVSPEQLLRWNPNVIIAADARFCDALLSEPRWAGLAAVQARKVFAQPSLPFGWIDAPPSVNRLIGARWLQAVLYGQGVDEALRREVRAFYELFYQVQLSNDQLADLLAENADAH